MSAGPYDGTSQFEQQPYTPTAARTAERKNRLLDDATRLSLRQVSPWTERRRELIYRRRPHSLTYYDGDDDGESRGQEGQSIEAGIAREVTGKQLSVESDSDSMNGDGDETTFRGKSVRRMLRHNEYERKEVSTVNELDSEDSSSAMLGEISSQNSGAMNRHGITRKEEKEQKYTTLKSNSGRGDEGVMKQEEESEEQEQEGDEDDDDGEQPSQPVHQSTVSEEPYEREMDPQYEEYFNQNPFLVLPDSQPDSNMIIDEEATERYPTLHLQNTVIDSATQPTHQESMQLSQHSSEHLQTIAGPESDMVDLDEYLEDNSSDLSPIPFPQTQSQSQQ